MTLPTEMRPAVAGDRPGIERLARGALDALAGSPSVQQWGPGTIDGYVRSWLPAAATEIMVQAGAGGAVLGMASIGRSRRHPAHRSLRVTVDPRHRRKGIGSALYDAVTGPGSFVVREFQSDPGTIAFYDDRGFIDGERATEGLIDPAAEPTSRWIDGTLAALDEVMVLPARDSPATERDMARVLDGMYRRSHAWSPPAPLREDQLEDTYLADALPEARFCAHEGARLIGAGVLLRSPFRDDPGIAHLMWVGVGDAGHELAEPITAALTARCLDAARTMELTVQVEVNTTHPELHRVVNVVPGADLFEDLTMMVGPG